MFLECVRIYMSFILFCLVLNFKSRSTECRGDTYCRRKRNGDGLLQINGIIICIILIINQRQYRLFWLSLLTTIQIIFDPDNSTLLGYLPTPPTNLASRCGPHPIILPGSLPTPPGIGSLIPPYVNFFFITSTNKSAHLRFVYVFQLQADTWGCPIMPAPLGPCPPFPQVSRPLIPHTQKKIKNRYSYSITL